MKNKLIEIYEKINSNSELYQKYTSTSSSGLGKIFYFLSTNYRQILSQIGNKFGGFANGFEILENVESVPRMDWYKTKETSQEKEKQHTVNMRESEFFIFNKNCFRKTSKGEVFKKMYNCNYLSYEEKRFLCYLLILPSYFNDTPSYIFSTTDSIFGEFLRRGFSEEYILSEMQKMISLFSNKKPKKIEIFDMDYLYLDTFIFPGNNIDFLEYFANSSEEEVTNFKNYIKEKYNNDKQDDLILQKFKNGGVYTINTLFENCWMLYLTRKLMSEQIFTFDMFIEKSIEAYDYIFNINKNHIIKFIFESPMHSEVFLLLYYKLYNIEIEINSDDNSIKSNQQVDIIDPTNMDGYKKYNQIIKSLKADVKNDYSYKCVFDNLEKCNYFLSKDDEKNYLEIHHFIPKGFYNNFDASIEIIENYVPLCANCHKKIHYAMDIERKHMIDFLFKLRKDKLHNKRIYIDVHTIYKFYRIHNIDS